MNTPRSIHMGLKVYDVIINLLCSFLMQC
jgi:hypothetical protein